MKQHIIFFMFLSCFLPQARSQVNDSTIIRSLFHEALSKGRAYEDLRTLCKSTGHRLSGSPQAQQAVEYTYRLMKGYGFDTVYLQEVMVPCWVRGAKEKAFARIAGGKKTELHVISLGNAVGTGPKGVNAEVIEVKGLKDLELLGKQRIEGKIVFFNRPFNPALISTFDCYRDAVDQRSRGAMEAARYGASAVIVRSMTNIKDQHPHTGALRYDDKVGKIPALAVSTADADMLSEAIQSGKPVQLSLFSYCEMRADVKSYNVIGEIRGAVHPEDIIITGGHLDSWDVGEGAHDDGAGCMQSVEALRLFRSLNLRPARTLRCVLFMNEENGLRGGKEYSEQAIARKEKHIAAIESDRGGFAPRGFSIDAGKDAIARMKAWQALLSPYGLDKMEAGDGGADISYLKEQGTALIGYIPDSQRYFDFHHAETDVFENVNKRELEMGAASIASLLWLLSQHGL